MHQVCGLEITTADTQKITALPSRMLRTCKRAPAGHRGPAAESRSRANARRTATTSTLAEKRDADVLFSLVDIGEQMLFDEPLKFLANPLLKASQTSAGSLTVPVGACR